MPQKKTESHTGVMKYYQPKQCILIREIPEKNDHRFAGIKFDSPPSPLYTSGSIAKGRQVEPYLGSWKFGLISVIST